MSARIDLVDQYFAVMANTPLKALVFYLVLALGAALPGWIVGAGTFITFVMWPLGVFGWLFTWGSAMPLFGLAYLCLFGCLYNYLVSEQTLRPLFWGFTICYVICLKAAGDFWWAAAVIYAALLGAYLFWEPLKKIREYERKCI